MDILFMGTPEFAIASLQVVSAEHNLVGVVTQPDRKRNRGQKIQFSPVKTEALKLAVPIFQPEKVNTDQFREIVTEINPHVIVVVAFGQKIPNWMLELPKHGCINVHSSLLPAYRGAAPIQYAIINGETITGVTTMYLNQGWDEGDILLQAEEPIYPTDTAGTLHDRLALRGARLLGESLRQLEQGTAPRIKQDHQRATFAYKLEKDDGKINWQHSAVRINNLIRGLNPWPVAFTFYQSQLVKVWEATIVDCPISSPGEILEISTQGILVGTSEGGILLKKLQRAGSRIMDAHDLANGIRMETGQHLGVGV